MQIVDSEYGDAMKIVFWDLGIIGKCKVDTEKNYSEVMPRGIAYGGFVKADNRELVLTNIVTKSILLEEEEYEGYLIVLQIDSIIEWDNLTKGMGGSYAKPEKKATKAKVGQKGV